MAPYSPSLSLKTLNTGILLLAVFTLELEVDYRSEISLCTAAPSLQTPLLQFFLRGGGGCTERLSGTDNPVLKMSVEIDVRRIVHSKLKISIFRLKSITYLTRNIKRITRLTRIIRLWSENSHFCYNECHALALSWAFACLLVLFYKDYF